MGKPHGINAARQLRKHRQSQRWKDKDYKRAHTSVKWTASPFGGASHASGIVQRKIGVEARQPNSGLRKCVLVQLLKNKKTITAFVPNEGCLDYVDENDHVLLSGVSGSKRRGRGDLPGVRYKIVKVNGTSLKALYLQKKEKKRL